MYEIMIVSSLVPNNDWVQEVLLCALSGASKFRVHKAGYPLGRDRWSGLSGASTHARHWAFISRTAGREAEKPIEL